MSIFIKTIVLSFLIVVPVFSEPFMISEDKVRIPTSIGKKLQLAFEDEKFFVLEDQTWYPIHSGNLRGLPKNLTVSQLDGFLAHGKLLLRKIDTDYGIEAYSRGLGGGGGDNREISWVGSIKIKKHGPITIHADGSRTEGAVKEKEKHKNCGISPSKFFTNLCKKPA